LADSGANVRVIERSKAVPPAARTLIATHRLRDFLGPVADHSIVNEIKGFELFADGCVASVQLKTPDVVVERAKLIATLVDEVRASGVDVMLGRRFVDFKVGNGGMQVIAERSPSVAESLQASTLIGGDGALSLVARISGWPSQSTVPLLQAMVRCPRGIASETARVWFRPEETRYFYWFIPEGPARGAVGLIGHTRHDARRLLDNFLREKRFVATGYQAARIPLYKGWRPVRRGPVYLVGDAAGHVKPSTVGGLVTGFRGAAAVADEIVGGRGSELHALRRELDRHLWVRRALHRFGEREYAKLIDLIRPSEKEVLASFSRDDTYRLLWRLFVRRPKIAALALGRTLLGHSTFVDD
jgi:flavin-dependent dehydrogenase